MNQRILGSLLLLIFLLVSVLTAQQIFTTINDPNGSIGTSDATGINNTGQIVGTSFALGKNQGFLDTNGSFTALKDPNGAGGTTARDQRHRAGHGVLPGQRLFVPRIFV